jgi:hypothetical protein
VLPVSKALFTAYAFCDVLVACCFALLRFLLITIQGGIAMIGFGESEVLSASAGAIGESEYRRKERILCRRKAMLVYRSR